jgi:hypothetical protein
MRRTSRWSWVMAGVVALVGGCQPGEEPSIPGASSSLALRADVAPTWVGKWTSHTPMSTARRLHTATLLNATGSVLVAGGNATAGHTASAEVYDPYADSWSPTGSLNLARAGHTATPFASSRGASAATRARSRAPRLLHTGQVLLTGGSLSGAPRASVSRYTLPSN